MRYVFIVILDMLRSPQRREMWYISICHNDEEIMWYIFVRKMWYISVHHNE